ncbi:exosortase C-terminal domain/associated protein EpsI [Chlamydiota bacterium]
MKKRFIGVIVALLMLGLSTVYLSRTSPPIDLNMYAKNIPLQIGEWEGTEVPVEPLVISILETEDIISRRYVLHSSTQIGVNVVFSSDNRRAVHPPEVCYRASGWEIAAKDQISISFHDENGVSKRLPITVLRAFKPSGKVVVLYWYKCGSLYTANFYKQQINVVLSQLLNRKSSAAMISMSINATNKNADEVEEKLKEFAQLLAPYISEYIP